MEKKTYVKPELKTRKMELGVFGEDYNTPPAPTGEGTKTIDAVAGYRIRME